jgi:hypothetical protein
LTPESPFSQRLRVARFAIRQRMRLIDAAVNALEARSADQRLVPLRFG